MRCRVCDQETERFLKVYNETRNGLLESYWCLECVAASGKVVFDWKTVGHTFTVPMSELSVDTLQGIIDYKRKLLKELKDQLFSKKLKKSS